MHQLLEKKPILYIGIAFIRFGFNSFGVLNYYVKIDKHKDFVRIYYKLLDSAF